MRATRWPRSRASIPRSQQRRARSSVVSSSAPPSELEPRAERGAKRAAMGEDIERVELRERLPRKAREAIEQRDAGRRVSVAILLQDRDGEVLLERGRLARDPERRGADAMPDRGGAAKVEEEVLRARVGFDGAVVVAAVECAMHDRGADVA